MRPYNIEFFDTSFNFIDHNTVDGDSLKLSFDYLDPENNKIKLIPPCTGDVNHYIRICGNGADIWGIITKKDIGKVDSGGTIEYTFKDFENYLDIDVLVDTDRIGVGSLEQFISDTITELYIENDDALQNIPGLTTEVLTTTTDWDLDLEPEEEGDHYCKAKLLDDIILPAFKQNFVRVVFKVDIGLLKITASISVCENDVLNYETRLPNVISSSIKYKQKKKEINKDIVCNKKNYETSVIFYLHTDGTHDTEDEDRVSPVVRKIETVSTKTAEEWEEKYVKDLTSANNTLNSSQSTLDKGETLSDEALEKLINSVALLNDIPDLVITINTTTGRLTGMSYKSQTMSYTKEALQTIIDEYAITDDYFSQCKVIAWDEFMEKATTKADKTFSANKYENNIEIKTLSDDTMLNPLSMEIGQIINVIDGNDSFQTILSGRKTDKGCTTLIFGTQRIELTKILKGRD